MDPQQGPPAQDAIIGQTIGNYLVTQKLGEGGMGAVYLAEHPSIGKKVALKVLHSEFSANEDVVTRFFNEAKAVNNIGHPNIVDITDYGVIQGLGREQFVYFIMEYLGGVTLSKLIRTESPLSPERALNIALQVADALAASHRCGIVHRDLKPDNIMLTSRGREKDFVKLLDFGIAKLTGGAAGSRQTRTGIVMGTPAYMSPEQCDGRGNIDHRTDVYALGVVMYEMLAGRVPFLGEGYGEVLVQHLTQPPIPPSQFRMVNPHVEAVILKSLEKQKELRYPTMDEMTRAMSDPVAYVEQHGGIATFGQVQLMPSSAPMPDIRTPSPVGRPTPTPSPGTLTPPHHQQPHIPTPGLGLQPMPMPNSPVTPIPTATVLPAQGKSKAGLIIGVLVVAVAAIVAIVLATRKDETNVVTAPSGSDTTPSGSSTTGPSGSSTVAAGTGSAKDVGSAKGSDAGSSTVAGSDAPGSGSAKEVDRNVNVTISTAMPATIAINGVVIRQKTGEPFPLPRSSDDVTVTLKPLDGKYDSLTFTIKPEQTLNLEKVFEKKKSGRYVPPGGGSAIKAGSGSAKVPGPGSGSAKVPGPGSAKTGSGSGKKLGDDIVRPGD
jgi:serine/threonine protein kinase